MKIKIDADGHRFSIPLPIGFIINGFTTRIIENCINRYAHLPITEELLFALLKVLKQAKKDFPDLALVDVRTADDQKVLITL